MPEHIELPPTLQGDEKNQLQQVWSYLYRLSEALNNNLEAIGGNELTDAERLSMQRILTAAGGGTEQGIPSDYETLKSLIIKTADFVQTSLQEYRMKLLGETVASGQFGRYVRQTGLDVEVTPEGITQNYSFQEIVQDLKHYEVNAKNYIKTGLLRTVSSIPVYGVAIGKDVVTFSNDGTETYHDGNKVAELTADELSFWQNGVKIAGYTGSRISFYYNGTEAFYILNGKLYAVGDMEITNGKKMILASGADLEVASGGDVIVKSGGTMTVQNSSNANIIKMSNAGLDIESSGNLNVKSGGNMTVKSGGTMTVQNSSNDNIIKMSNAGLDIESNGNLNVKSGGNMTVKSGGTLQVQNSSNNNIIKLSNAGLDIESSGNLNVKSGGNMTVKSGGTLAIQNSSNNNIIKMSNAGLDVESGGTVTVKSGGNMDVNSGGNMNIKSGGTFAVKNSSNNNVIKMDNSGIDVESGGDIKVKSGGSFEVQSGGTFDVQSTNFSISSNDKKMVSGNWELNQFGLISKAVDSVIQETVGIGFGEYRTFLENNIPVLAVTGSFTKPSGKYVGHYRMTMKDMNDKISSVVFQVSNESAYIYAQKATLNSSTPSENIPGYLGNSDAPWEIQADQIVYNYLSQRSSRYIKQDIKPLQPVGEKLDQLVPVTFIYKKDQKGKRRTGMIYEDTIRIMPEICTEGNGDKTINYVEMIPMLLKEIQELRARVKALEER